MIRISTRSLLRTLFVPRNPRRFLVALSVIGVVASKCVHIYEHLLYERISIEFLVFFPTLFIFDIFILSFIVYCLYRPSIRDLFLFPAADDENTVGVASRMKNNKAFHFVAAITRIGLILCGIILPLVIYCAASSEVSFYWQSGQQVMWSMTGRVLHDPKSFTNMFSEGTYVAGIVLVFFWILARVELLFVDRIIALLPSWARFTDSKKDANGDYRDVESYCTTDDDSHAEEEKILAKVKAVSHARRPGILRRYVWATTTATTAVLILSFFRPLRKYDGMVTTVPMNMLEALEDSNKKSSSSTAEFCGSGGDTMGNGLLEFPYPELVSWGLYDESNSDTEWFSTWLPDKPPKGFERFSRKNNEEWRKWGKKALLDPKIAGRPANPLSMGGFFSRPKPPVDLLSPPKGYHHAYDPLKLSNLHLDLHPELRADNPPANDNLNKTTRPLKDVKIRNIVLLTLESTRSQVFPIRNHTRLVEDAFKAREAGKKYSDLLNLTPTAARLAGKALGKGGAGGIVIEGAVTGSEYTFKSLLLSHCGLNPLAVDFMEELAGEQYQACIPQILKLLNEHRGKEAGNSTDWRNAPWMTKFVQSVTTYYDRQLGLLKMMGFNTEKDLVYKETMEKGNAKFKLPQGEETLNYFGFREAVTKPYIKDMIQQSKKEGKRLFLSHVTSSTHHPWPTPDRFWNKRNFLDDKERNNYFNTIGFVDHWLGEILDLLEEEKIADETLVVVLGDHGVSIGEGGSADSGRVSTFANPHVNNFRIPIVMHHPHLPPVHVTVNATNLSILPSILDLLLSSDSLPKEAENALDAKILRALRPVYEGQSLLRPLVHRSPKGLQNYNFGVLNPGGTHLVVTSSDPVTPYRLAMPLCLKTPYGVADLREDSEEEDVLRMWATNELYQGVEKRWGITARAWTEKGVAVGRWWIREGRRRWNYSDGARKDDWTEADKEHDGTMTDEY